MIDVPAFLLSLVNMRGYIDDGREAVAYHSGAPQPSRRIFFTANELNEWNEFAKDYEKRQRETSYGGSISRFCDAWTFKTVSEMRDAYG